MLYEVQKIHVENEFKICPTCQYRDGFHMMLKNYNGMWKNLYICPACHDVFDLDLSRSKDEQE